MRLSSVVLALVSVCSLGSVATEAADRPVGRSFATRSEVMARNGMAATSQPLATQIAIDILKQGGNAIDAAIAANAALGLMEPTGCGIGGDLFALVWDAKSGRLHGLNASGRSPKGQSLADLKAALAAQNLGSLPALGPLPITVPGAVDGWFELHQRFGKLPMKTVLAPAIHYAREGFPVSPVIAALWARSAGPLSAQPGFRSQMTLDGRAPKAGEIWRNANLAATYEKLGKDGRDTFYKGEIAKQMDAFFRQHGGALRYADFAAHQSEWVAPISTTYRGVEVWELPPNTQGLSALQMLEVMERFDLARMGFASADHLHVVTEAKKLAFADRAKFFADPMFAKTPIAFLLSDPYNDARAKQIDLQRAKPAYDAGHPPLNDGDTIYLTTADKDGNMVSLIQSNYRGMGSGMAPDGLGFVFQDRGQMFALEDGHANVYAPGKRPFHTIIPAFITRNGKPWVSFGVMGGAMQPQGHAQIVSNLIDFGMNLQEAGDAPRLYHEAGDDEAANASLRGGVLHLESGIDPAVLQTLMARGHRLGWNAFGYGGYQAIARDPDTGVYRGASESRKDGQAAGY